MSVINLLVAARNALAERRHRNQAYDELMALDDRSLADIGVHRSQIATLVDGFHPDDQAATHLAGIMAPAFAPQSPRLAGGAD